MMPKEPVLFCGYNHKKSFWWEGECCFPSFQYFFSWNSQVKAFDHSLDTPKWNDFHIRYVLVVPKQIALRGWRSKCKVDYSWFWCCLMAKSRSCWRDVGRIFWLIKRTFWFWLVISRNDIVDWFFHW